MALLYPRRAKINGENYNFWGHLCEDYRCEGYHAWKKSCETRILKQPTRTSGETFEAVCKKHDAHDTMKHVFTWASRIFSPSRQDCPLRLPRKETLRDITEAMHLAVNVLPLVLYYAAN
jgi:hypothetical protein